MKNQTLRGIELNKMNLNRWLGDHPTLLAVVIAIFAAILLAVLMGGVNTGVSVNTF